MRVISFCVEGGGDGLSIILKMKKRKISKEYLFSYINTSPKEQNIPYFSLHLVTVCQTNTALNKHARTHLHVFLPPLLPSPGRICTAIHLKKKKRKHKQTSCTKRLSSPEHNPPLPDAHQCTVLMHKHCSHASSCVTVIKKNLHKQNVCDHCVSE